MLTLVGDNEIKATKAGLEQIMGIELPDGRKPTKEMQARIDGIKMAVTQSEAVVPVDTGKKFSFKKDKKVGDAKNTVR